MTYINEFFIHHPPWSPRVSILNAIKKHQPLTIDSDFSRYRTTSVEDIKSLLIEFLQNPDSSRLDQLYLALLILGRSFETSRFNQDYNRSRWWSSFQLLEKIESVFQNFPDSEVSKAAEFGDWLTRFSPDKSAVKWGILFLGYFRNFRFKENLMTIGSHEEFVMFVTSHVLIFYLFKV